MLPDEVRKAERDPQPLASGPTKWRAEHCVTHHHAYDCREWEHACELERWQGIAELSHGKMAERLEQAEALLPCETPDTLQRLEAAERDAKGERSESWGVWQDDMCVAGSDSLADAQHYMMMYGQDGPVKMVHVVTFRSDVIETVPADQLAIDATQEGEG